MNIKKTITKLIIISIFFLLLFTGIRNTFFGNYSIINYIKTRKETEVLKKIKTNNQQEKIKLIYKIKQLKLNKNLTNYTIKKINTINNNYFIIN